MKTRPHLTNQLSPKEFLDFYYLKEELVDFCRRNGLQTSGGKLEITHRIEVFLRTGERTQKSRKSSQNLVTKLKLDSLIEENIKCSEIHRAFFKEQLGTTFSFNVAFQTWLKSNAGKTYQDACDAYTRIKAEKRVTKTTIDKQFEYNTYIRDFFAANNDYSLNDAIQCWKYKKSLPGHNKYDVNDLAVLTK